MSDADDLLRESTGEIRKSDRMLRQARDVYKRRSQRPLTDPRTDGRETVCLRVAAAYLHMNERTLRARIDDKRIVAHQDGKVYRIACAEIVAYELRQRRAS